MAILQIRYTLCVVFPTLIQQHMRYAGCMLRLLVMERYKIIKDPCTWRECIITGEPTVIIGNPRKLGQRLLLCRCPIRISNLTVHILSEIVALLLLYSYCKLLLLLLLWLLMFSEAGIKAAKT